MLPIADAPRGRSFIAISLAEPARTAVVAYLERLRATVGGVAWTRPEHLHLTLKFLGDVDVGCIPALGERLRTVAATTAPFMLRVAGVGAFPSLARPRVLWVGVMAPGLLALSDGIEHVCRAEGFAPEPRALRPHVTLGRVRAGGRSSQADLGFLASDGDRELGSSPVAEIVLFRSELRSGGARHTALVTLPLGTAT
ncbi:MAG: RNA 2',3'-cyclic phosphodiesterase [Candidatus Binatia bacterium]